MTKCWNYTSEMFVNWLEMEWNSNAKMGLQPDCGACFQWYVSMKSWEPFDKLRGTNESNHEFHWQMFRLVSNHGPKVSAEWACWWGSCGAAIIFDLFAFYSPEFGHLTHDVYPGVKYLIEGGHSYAEQNNFRSYRLSSHSAHQNIYLCRVSHKWG